LKVVMYKNLARKFGLSRSPIDRHFKLTLPTGWIKYPTNDGFNFVHEVEGEQLIVTVLEAKKPPLRLEQIQVAVKELIVARRDAIIELSGRDCQFNSEDGPTASVPVFASFGGLDKSNRVCFSIYFNGYPGKIFTFAYYKYDCLEESRDTGMRLKELIHGLEVDATC